jgi:hypothetical protein
MTKSSLLALPLLALAGCSQTAFSSDPPTVTVTPDPVSARPAGSASAAVASATAPVHDALHDGPSLKAKTLRFAEGSMEVAAIDAPYSSHAWPRGGVFQQAVRLADNDVLRVVVRVGEGEGLDGYRRDHQGDAISAPVETAACGRPAVRLQVDEPEQHITCIIYADGRPNSPGYVPAETSIVVGFEGHRGMGVTAEWRIPTRRREQYRALEDAFFSRLRCR